MLVIIGPVSDRHCMLEFAEVEYGEIKLVRVILADIESDLGRERFFIDSVTRYTDLLFLG